MHKLLVAILVLLGAGTPAATPDASEPSPVSPVEGAPAKEEGSAKSPSEGSVQPAAPPAAEAAVPFAPVKVLPGKDTSGPVSIDAEANTLPPALTSRALFGELQRSAKERATDQAARTQERQRLDEEYRRVAEEKKALTRMANEVARAREALRQETVRLQALSRDESQRLDTKDQQQKEAAKASAPPPSLVNEQVESLAKAMRTMKADQAATLITKLERRLSIALLARMRPADAGAVLERLSPELAADLMGAVAVSPKKAKP